MKSFEFHLLWVAISALFIFLLMPFVDTHWATVPQSVPIVMWIGVVSLLGLSILGIVIRDRNLFFLFLVTAFTLSVFFVFAPASVEDSKSRNPIIFASWNTRYWDQNERPNLMIDGIRILGADIVTLQEHIYWDDVTQRIIPAPPSDLSKLGYLYFWDKGELVTVSKYPGEVIPVADPNILLVKIRTDRMELYVLNIHVPVHITLFEWIWSSGFWSYTENAGISRDHTFAALNDIMASHHKIVAAGDFNSTLLMPPLRNLVWKYAYETIFAQKGSFPSDRRFLKDFWRIDHVLHKDIETTNCDIKQIGLEYGSDHEAIKCTISQ